MIKNTDFVNRLVAFSKLKNRYAKGTFGNKATKAFIRQKIKQYPEYYNPRKKDFDNLDEDTLLFDCAGLIKAGLWLDGSGKITYKYNNISDLNDAGLINICATTSTNFLNIPVGALLHKKGHVGVYIGNGEAIECTGGTINKIIISNDLKKWTSWGLLPWVEYGDSFEVAICTDYLELHKAYNIAGVITDRRKLYITETRENFGKTSGGYWVDLTKCKRI